MVHRSWSKGCEGYVWCTGPKWSKGCMVRGTCGVQGWRDAGAGDLPEEMDSGVYWSKIVRVVV